MAFTAQIVFSGICGIVPQQANPPNPPGAFCVVLPNGWKKEPDSTVMKTSKVDQVSRIRRHAPFVALTSLPPDPTNTRQDLEGLWFLQGHRLFINPTFGGTPPAAAWGGAIGGLASFENIAAPNNQSLLSVKNAVNTPTSATVAAQVILRSGELSCPPLNLDWVFDDFLRRVTTPPETPKLNFQVTINLQNLVQLDVVQTDFNNAPTGLKASFIKGPVLVKVSNLCDENPLQWGDKPAQANMFDDDDFRLHYDIVDDIGALKTALDVLRCPIPRLAANFAGGNGLNCLPLRFSFVNFAL